MARDTEVVDTRIVPGREYSGKELDAIATELLRQDCKSIDPETGKQKGTKGENAIIFKGLKVGTRWDHDDPHEVINPNGVPETNLVKVTGTGRRQANQPGMYNRTHPEGRKVNSQEQRDKNGASFYR